MFGSIRRFGPVTSKLQVRREAFIKSKYPEYAGNDVNAATDSGRKGRRLGGVFRDSAKPPLRLDRSESFSDSAEREAISAEFAEKLKSAASVPEKITSIIAQYQEALTLLDSTKEPVSHERSRKIKQVTSMDFPSEQKNKRPLKLPPVKTRPFPVVREEEEHQYSLPRIRESLASKFWENLNAKDFVEIASVSVPAVISSSLAEYSAAHNSAAFFDESFRSSLTISGEDCLFVMDHFVTAPVANLNIGDSVQTAILDSKGYVISTGWVSRLGETEFELFLDEYRESVFRYLAQYVVYARQSGMHVSLRPVETSVMHLSVFGPDRFEILESLAGVAKVTLGEEGEVLPTPGYLQAVPPMTLVTFNANNPNENVRVRMMPNSLIISVPEPHIESILPKIKERALPGGMYALDMLRMEQGIPRPEIDIPSTSCSPVKASLTSLIDQRKVRENVLFGHDRITKELQRGVSHKRVGIVASAYVYGGCRLLSSPHRHVVGEITSCAWSPVLKKRICQALVKPEYAVAGNPLLVTVPLAVPESINFRFKRRIVKQGQLRTVFRKLVSCNVVEFPLHRHSVS